MKRAYLTGAMMVALAAVPAVATAQTFPTRPLTMMVGFPPGGPTDTLARIVADGMKNTLGQAIAVETVSGASGTIATGRVVHAAPDGYTLGIGQWSTHVGSPALYNLDYDVLKDLQPLSLLAYSPLWILGKASLPPNTPAELIDWAKKSSQPITVGTVGTGSAAQLCAIYFAQKTGAHFQYVPYRGAAPALQDLIGGQIDLSCLEASATLPSVEAGKVKAYAVLSEQRWPKSPNTPTMIESGVPGLSITFWHGLWTTKGTPKPVVDRLVASVQKALADPGVRGRLETLGFVIFPPEKQPPAALEAYNKAEIDKWWPVIKAAGIKVSE
jgi:tripartite-type tricarboxylate transporter receptor subunit TctC